MSEKNLVGKWNETVAENAAVSKFRSMVLDTAADSVRNGEKGALPSGVLAHLQKVGDVPEGTLFGISATTMTVEKVNEFLRSQGLDTSGVPPFVYESYVLEAVAAIEEKAKKEKSPFDFRLYLTSILPELPTKKREGHPNVSGILAIEQFRDLPVRMFEAVCHRAGALYVVEPWAEIERSRVEAYEAEFRASNATSWDWKKTAPNKREIN